MKISGKILDNSGEPLGLANVTIITGEKANKLGVIADLDGGFFLENDLIMPDSVFQISYMGFSPLNFTASELQNKTINLSETARQIKEVTINMKPKATSNSKNLNNFKENLQKHKYVYASLGALVGILLITTSLKK